MHVGKTNGISLYGITVLSSRSKSHVATYRTEETEVIRHNRRRKSDNFPLYETSLSSKLKAQPLTYDRSITLLITLGGEFFLLDAYTRGYCRVPTRSMVVDISRASQIIVTCGTIVPVGTRKNSICRHEHRDDIILYFKKRKKKCNIRSSCRGDVGKTYDSPAGMRS